MGRQNFIERIEQNLNLQNEYEKLEKIVLKYTNDYNISLNDEIESYFDLWKYKQNYLYFDELRWHLGFTYIKAWDYSFDTKIESIDNFFVNCEMILNMILGCITWRSSNWNGSMKYGMTESFSHISMWIFGVVTKSFILNMFKATVGSRMRENCT